MQVTIAGEPRTLGGFSAYKAFYAMQILADGEAIGRRVLNEAADFKREYEARNFVEMTRAEARREHPPKALMSIVRREIEDGRIEIAEEPVRDEHGQVVTIDPLGHMTEEDWAADDHRMRVSESPPERIAIAAMIPVAFRHGRKELLRLLALVLTSNADLERWDGDGDVDAELQKIADSLMHSASIEELTDLASAALELCREQIAGPFGRLMAEARTTFGQPRPAETETTPAAAAFVAEEEDETPDSPTSSTESPADTDGTPASSSTEPASVS